jgi:hypothetical protein
MTLRIAIMSMLLMLTAMSNSMSEKAFAGLLPVEGLVFMVVFGVGL